MRIFGDYRIVDNNVVTCHINNEDRKPFLFIHEHITNTAGDVTLAPRRAEQSHLIEMLVPLDADDGFLLWFACARHPRFRLQRYALRNCVAILSGGWGNSALLIVSADRPASVMFRHRDAIEELHLDSATKTVIRTESRTTGI